MAGIVVVFFAAVTATASMVRALAEAISQAFHPYPLTVRAELAGSLESRFKIPPAPVFRRRPRRRRRAARCLAGRLDRSCRLTPQIGAHRGAGPSAAHRRPGGWG